MADPEAQPWDLVEIFGLEPCKEENAPSVELNGEAGRILEYSEEGQRYVVETFSGVTVGIPEANLREFKPPSAEDGGFDLPWPAHEEDQPAFASSVAGLLAEKGYCVVQLFTPGSYVSSAVDDVAKEQGWGGESLVWALPKEDFEVAYLGRENETKMAYLSMDTRDLSVTNAISECDRTLTLAGEMLGDSLRAYLGVDVWGRHAGLVRVPLEGRHEQKELRPEGLCNEDYEDGGAVYGHIGFLERQKVCLMYLIDNDGGDLVLQPDEGLEDLAEVLLPLTRSKIVIYRSDLMAHTYKPHGDSSVLLQTWLLSKPFITHFDDEGIVVAPDSLCNERIHIVSFDNHFPADVNGDQGTYVAYGGGLDSHIRIPQLRFDIDIYYTDNKNDWNPAKFWAQHGAYIPDISSFDNEFFGISADEAGIMGTTQRMTLELGYSTLVMAGHNRKTLNGLSCGFYVGDMTGDWFGIATTHFWNRSDFARSRIEYGAKNHYTAQRLHHIMGMKGPIQSVDTACSSSLVALGNAHLQMRDGGGNPHLHTDIMKESLVMGIHHITSPNVYFAYCAAQMVSIGGRCFTYDESANGFGRGEGHAAAVLRRNDRIDELQSMLACMLGSCVNQDGRSASLSAPNGPAQQVCIRTSMLESGLRPSEITIAECHGTGTALGDPIELGALRDVMKDRSEIPICTTSAKSNYGHMEACAGITGAMKCVALVRSSTSSPNVHLKAMNPHIEFNGYPAIFETESVDTGFKTGIAGVSSFGVGGTNARGDIWGRAIWHSRKTREVSVLRDLSSRIKYFDKIRQYGQPGPQADQVFLVGTWSAFKEMDEMEYLEDGSYVAYVALGEGRNERFYIVCNGDKEETVFPEFDGQGCRGTVLGPGINHERAHWLLDGREDGMAVGQVYEIRFFWSFSWDFGERLAVSWRPTDDPEALATAAAKKPYEHSYQIVGSWASGAYPKTMERQPGGEGVFEAKATIGALGQEQFHFLRDNDSTQMIYPAKHRAVTPNIPVVGPDADGNEKRWLVRGTPGDRFSVQLWHTAEGLRLTLRMERSGEERTWHSPAAGIDWHAYQVAAKNSGLSTAMAADQDAPGVYRAVVKIGKKGREEFQIILDGDWQTVYYPYQRQALCGQHDICGPDGEGQGKYWRIEGFPGANYEVVLDLTQEALNRVVTWEALDALADAEG